MSPLCHFLIYIAIVFIPLSRSQSSDKSSSNPCVTKETCGQCIRAAADCAWCTEDDYTSDGSRRCDYIGNLARGCNETNVVFPKSDFEKTQNTELSNKGTKEGAVQIKPQRVHLKLKPNSPFQLTVEFRQAEDYPVDLYYLMDLSKSMEDDKGKLADLGDLLAENMGNITNNFRLGFGSFVDKVVMPYVSTVPEKLKAPCSGCAAPYGFFNQMPLDLDTSRFAQQVNEARVSGNLDAPEGGFDAIMQAIVCQDKIGWREKSRKMLVFSSDSGFHYAGDGKLGGIVKPNDGRCHLDKKGYYTESTEQDYPSLSQLNQKIQENKITVIFAITANQLPVYERLSGQLEGARAGKLENDSSNVVTLVREQYDNLTSGVEMRDNATSDVKITYYSTCLDGKREKRNVCKGLKVGTNVTFEAHIEVKSCPKNKKDWRQTIQVYPIGLNEAMTIDLEMICECECEKKINQIPNSDKCSMGNGTYQCGICSCYQNRYGRECECDSKETSQAIDEAACFNDNDTKPCSGRGACRCGVCDCFPRHDSKEKVTGQYCECDNFSCDRNDGEFCSGESHGECVCGQCHCKSGWTGDACQCPDNDDACEADNGKICSGHGKCECGRCKCTDTEEERYSGPFCEECPTCPGKCDIFKDCVQCQMFQTGKLTEEECKNCSFLAIRVEEVEIEKEDEEKLCIFKDESDDCKFTFKYRLDEGNVPMIHAQITKDCPEGINILAIILGVIGGIVAIGLALLLIWKLLTTIHDRREFAKFEKERQMAKWDTGENPIYKQATSEFQNPTYGGKN